MREILGDRAYKAAKKQTMKKLSTLREVILDASRQTSRPHSSSKNLKIEIRPARKKK